jgi:hypothetical protein
MAATATMRVAERLCALASEGKGLDAIHELYADDALQIEAIAMPGRWAAGSPRSSPR